MSDNHLKTPLNYSLGKWIGDRQARTLQVPGRAYPCTVVTVTSPGFVTVNFEVATGGTPLPQVGPIPIEYPEYIRYPIQVGDKGLCLGADAYLGQITGLGPKTVPDLTQPMNLGALSFVWLSSMDWNAPLDADAVELWQNVTVSPTEIGFFGTSKVAQQEITGALSTVSDPAAQAVLQSLLDALVAYGLVTDGTT